MLGYPAVDEIAPLVMEEHWLSAQADCWIRQMAKGKDPKLGNGLWDWYLVFFENAFMFPVVIQQISSGLLQKKELLLSSMENSWIFNVILVWHLSQVLLPYFFKFYIFI